MVFTIYDATGRLRFESTNWPMSRSVLDLVISEDLGCPQLLIRPELEGTAEYFLVTRDKKERAEE